MKIQLFLKAFDTDMNRIQPKTIDDAIDIFNATYGRTSYSFHVSIVKYMGALQGIRFYVSARTKTYCLPTNGRVYSVFQDTEKYEKAGCQIDHEPIIS